MEGLVRQLLLLIGLIGELMEIDTFDKKIDLIVTKLVSKLARNTVNTLKLVKKFPLYFWCTLLCIFLKSRVIVT